MRSFAQKHGERIDDNRGLIGLGAANLAAGLLQGFPAAASQSRTAVNDAAGGRTPLVGIIAAALNLLEVRPLVQVYRVRWVEFFLAIITLVGVLSIGILPGILVAVALLVVIRRISRPHDAVLGSVEVVDGYQDIEGYANSETVPGLIAYRFDAPLFFANVDYFLSQVRELVASAETPLAWLLIDAEGTVDIDVTALAALDTLQRELALQGIVLAIARANHPLQKMLKRAGLVEGIGSQHLYPTVRTGVQTFLERGER